MRINKRLSELGYCSRREADRLIQENRITVNGKPIVLGQQVEASDSIEVDGKPVAGSGRDTGNRPKPVLLAYYKPRGVVCTTSDKDRATNIVESVNYPERVYPVGRLDKDSEGLILLTNQGDLVNRINRSGNHHEKEYVVVVNKPLQKEVLDQMADGVYLEELSRKTLPCEIWQDRMLPPSRRSREFHIVITQGMNRQIRRMCSAFGYEVKRLKRVRIMNLWLQGLHPGEYREISPEELGELTGGLPEGAEA